MQKILEATALPQLRLDHRRISERHPVDFSLPAAVVSPSRHIFYSMQLLKVGIPIWVADMVATVFAVLLAYTLVTPLINSGINHLSGFVICALAANSLCFWSNGLYPGVGVHPAKELKNVFRAALTSACVLAVGFLLVSQVRSPYVCMAAASFPLQLLLLLPARMIAKAGIRRFGLSIPFYCCGHRSEVLRLYKDMSQFGWALLRPVGRFDEWPAIGAPENKRSKVATELERQFDSQVVYRGTLELLPAMAKTNKVYWLFLVGEHAADMFAESDPLFSMTFPEVVCIRPLATHVSAVSSVINCGLSSGVRIEESLLLPWPAFVKRTFDILLSGLALFFLSPVILLLALAIRLSGEGSIFFGHNRLGRAGRNFRAWKFRSMVKDASDVLYHYLDANPDAMQEWSRDHKLKSDPRITWIGKILRKTSLDELPQLWNVFVGEMSLVGPRPIVEAEIVKYGNIYRHYSRVKPGITGLWQISGRNNTTYEERLAYDEFYVRNWSPWLDLYILLRTIKTVVFCEGAY